MELRMEIVTEKDAIYNLATAIILRAVADYKKAQKAMRSKKASKSMEGRRQVDEIERFFRSQWFGILCEIDAEEFIGRLRKDETYRIFKASQATGREDRGRS